MNPNTLSVEEVIHYVNNGTIEGIDSAAFMRVVEYYEDKISSINSLDRDYDDGYDTGWDEAIDSMRRALDNL